ncbi:MAG TPA: hypothetical protein VGQ86_02895 [Candidatus Limnocylindria bacterium]|nr:hypothetical protein [Candidatus Limnocylindria bacterium]
MRLFSLLVFAAAALTSACGSSNALAGSADSSYDRIEALRASRAVEADRRYDRIEELRGAGRTNVSDDSYDRVEAHRLTWGK